MARTAIILRTPSGLSGDMLVTGLSRLAKVSDAEINSIIDSIGLSQLKDVVKIQSHSVQGISGWCAVMDLPEEHCHRTLHEITALIQDSSLEAGAKQLALDTFVYLGKVEASIHGIEIDAVAFHEVGALDSIVDICLSAALFDKIGPANLYCSPLPLCDGVISCEHGPLASPAPAVQEMLRGVPVYGIDSKGETVTPTALAFLKAANVKFGKWPQAEIDEVARAYGRRILPGVPNGAMFFLGRE